MTNPKFSVQPMAGRQLPADWKLKAATMGAAAGAAYVQRLENAWRGNDKDVSASANIMRASRLSPPSWPDIIGDK